MAQDNDGRSYLAALKRGAPSNTDGATATAPALETNANSHADPGAPASPGDSEQFRGAEKRRSARYKCEGSAEIREEGCEVRTWATFTDVSMHGCYVEAQATYAAGTVLNMKLEANGYKVETKGEVRVHYPYLGMGIAFREMSDESKARLKQLLGTVSHHSIVMGPGIASALPRSGALEAVPLISNPEAAVQALIIFFEDRHMLTREDFLAVLRKSQERG